ncbi:MAG: hypothetical protein AB1630_12185 [bacterium]
MGFNEWKRLCCEKVRSDFHLKEKKLSWTVDSRDLLLYMFQHLSHHPVRPIVKIVFEHQRMILLPGVILSLIHTLESISTHQEKVAQELDYQRFINHGAVREFLRISPRDSTNFLKRYIEMEKTCSFLHLLTTSGIRGRLGIPMERLGFLTRNGWLVPIEKIANVEIIASKTKEWYYRFIGWFSSKSNGLDIIDDFNISLIEALNKDYPSLSFKMMSSFYIFNNRRYFDLIRSPLEVLCFLKSKEKNKPIEEDDPIFEKLGNIFKNRDPNEDLLLKQKAEELQEILQDKNQFYSSLEENGKRIQDLIEGLKGWTAENFASLEDTLIETYDDYIAVKREIEKRKAIRWK